MKVLYKGIFYVTQYEPFTIKEKHDIYDLYEITFPSGLVDEVISFNKNSQELQSYLYMLIDYYMNEQDDNLSEKAKELKQDVRKLFGLN